MKTGWDHLVPHELASNLFFSIDTDLRPFVKVGHDDEGAILVVVFGSFWCQLHRYSRFVRLVESYSKKDLSQSHKIKDVP